MGLAVKVDFCVLLCLHLFLKWTTGNNFWSCLCYWNYCGDCSSHSFHILWIFFNSRNSWKNCISSWKIYFPPPFQADFIRPHLLDYFAYSLFSSIVSYLSVFGCVYLEGGGNLFENSHRNNWNKYNLL